MKRAPTTFTLVLSLVALALLLALTIVALASARTRLEFASKAYSRLIVSTALAADDLSGRDDEASRHTLDALEQSGVRFVDGNAPPSRHHVTPMLAAIGRDVGRRLGDPSRVLVRQMPEAQIWVRSGHTAQRWIIVLPPAYRHAVVNSTLVVMVLAGLIALAVATIAARLLTRPLERLSAHASALLAGDPMIGEQLRGSAREVRQLARAIGDAGEDLRLAARDRELMLAGISHDLRTPLARLRLALELGDAGDPQRRAAMVTDLDQLDSALEQSLAFVRDRRDEVRRATDVTTLVGQLLALRTRPEDWQFDAPARLSVPVRPILLRRAIGNLMDNAERHGAAPFEVSLKRDGRSMQLRVADHGPGVAAPLIDQLGRPFLRGEPSAGGSGLGLSIAARAARLHGGELQLRNGTQGGFVATLRIPA